MNKCTGRNLAVSFLFAVTMIFSLHISIGGGVAQAEVHENPTYQNLNVDTGNTAQFTDSCEAGANKGEGHPPRRCPLRHY